MDWLTVVLPGLVALTGGAIGWFLKSRIEAQRLAQEALRDQRAQLYMDILVPFAKLFSDLSPKNQQNVIKQIMSFEYRKLGFHLSLVGSDAVVSAWNLMWRRVYAIERGEGTATDILLGFGDVLLAARKGIGSTRTKLDSRDMLRWMIKDIDTI